MSKSTLGKEFEIREQLLASKLKEFENERQRALEVIKNPALTGSNTCCSQNKTPKLTNSAQVLKKCNELSPITQKESLEETDWLKEYVNSIESNEEEIIDRLILYQEQRRGQIENIIKPVLPSISHQLSGVISASCVSVINWLRGAFTMKNFFYDMINCVCRYFSGSRK